MHILDFRNPRLKKFQLDISDDCNISWSINNKVAGITKFSLMCLIPIIFPHFTNALCHFSVTVSPAGRTGCFGEGVGG
jgi:hypothetical protein